MEFSIIILLEFMSPFTYTNTDYIKLGAETAGTGIG